MRANSNSAKEHILNSGPTGFSQIKFKTTWAQKQEHKPNQKKDGCSQTNKTKQTLEQKAFDKDINIILIKVNLLERINYSKYAWTQ